MGGDGGKIKWKLSEVDTRAVSRGQNKLIGNFKIVAGDVISVRGQVRSTHTFEQKGVGEIWYGRRPEGVSCRDCLRKTGGHSL